MFPSLSSTVSAVEGAAVLIFASTSRSASTTSACSSRSLAPASSSLPRRASCALEPYQPFRRRTEEAPSASRDGEERAAGIRGAKPPQSPRAVEPSGAHPDCSGEHDLLEPSLPGGGCGRANGFFPGIGRGKLLDQAG